MQTYRQFKNEAPCETEAGRLMVDKYAYRATLEEIQENDYNLNIPRYVDTYEEEEPVDIPATLQEIERLKAELAETEQEMAKYLTELGFNQQG